MTIIPPRASFVVPSDGVLRVGFVGAAPLLDSLIAYWDLDEASGTRADSHTSGLDLTDNNTVGSTTGVGGSGTAADFVASNSEYLSRASSSELQAGDIDFTFALWINPDTVASDIFVLQKNGGAGPTIEYSLDIVSSTGKLRWEFFTGGAWRPVDTSSALSSSTWQFIVCWYSTSDNKLSIQVDNGTAATSSALGVTPPTGTGNFAIGRYEFASSNYWDGAIQSVGFWKRLLTADEKTWLYNSGSAARTYADVAAYTG